jgi:hypothetical protein
MSKIIQQVPLGDKESLYILDFNKEKEELTFRTSRIPEYKQTEKIQLRDNNICTNLYFFHQNYLVKFLKENGIWAD